MHFPVLRMRKDHERYVKGFSVGRCCGARAAAHLQSSGQTGCPGSLCACGGADRRHSDRPGGSFPGKTSVNKNNDNASFHFPRQYYQKYIQMKSLQLRNANEEIKRIYSWDYYFIN